MLQKKANDGVGLGVSAALDFVHNVFRDCTSDTFPAFLFLHNHLARFLLCSPVPGAVSSSLLLGVYILALRAGLQASFKHWWCLPADCFNSIPACTRTWVFVICSSERSSGPNQPWAKFTLFTNLTYHSPNSLCSTPATQTCKWHTPTKAYDAKPKL